MLIIANINIVPNVEFVNVETHCVNLTKGAKMRCEGEIKSKIFELGIKMEIAKENGNDFEVIELYTKIKMLIWVLEDDCKDNLPVSRM